ncbi:MAG: type II toxin-antitoxin system Phd/YefM family antitoxin [Defluviitaleaceae bacterium]|nr:type II toxin-antitoxin system Phd/YefM family antitoxin [Defluviitaleaceae bacterium]
MPTIKPSAYLRNNYNEVSEFCHSNDEPMFITKNGHGDLAVMSIKTYQRLFGRYELYNLLDEGMEDIKAGNYRKFDDFVAEFRKEMYQDDTHNTLI